MSKVDRSHRSFTAKTTIRKVLKVNSESEDRPKVATPDDGPLPWEEQARPSGSEPAQNADFVVEVRPAYNLLQVRNWAKLPWH